MISGEANAATEQSEAEQTTAAAGDAEKVQVATDAEKAQTVDYGAEEGDHVEYTLGEGTTIGGYSTFDAEIVRLYPDGKADLKFVPVGAESEPVVHEGVPNGPGTAQWLAYPPDDKSEHPGDTI